MRKHIRKLKVYGIPRLKHKSDPQIDLFPRLGGRGTVLVTQINRNQILMLTWHIPRRILVSLSSMRHLKTSSGVFKPRIPKIFALKLKSTIRYFSKLGSGRKILLKLRGRCVFVQHRLQIVKA